MYILVSWSFKGLLELIDTLTNAMIKKVIDIVTGYIHSYPSIIHYLPLLDIIMNFDPLFTMKKNIPSKTHR